MPRGKKNVIVTSLAPNIAPTIWCSAEKSLSLRRFRTRTDLTACNLSKNAKTPDPASPQFVGLLRVGYLVARRVRFRSAFRHTA